MDKTLASDREEAEAAATRWLAQRHTGPWGEADVAEFNAWLSQSLSHQVAYYRYLRTWEDAGRLKALSKGAMPERPLSDAFPVSAARSDEKWEHEFDGDQARPSARRARTVLAVAASLTLVVGLGIVLFYERIFDPNTYSTSVGGLVAVPLADGSRITLNTDSRIRVALDDRERRIDLERGEAFFEVNKDPRRPFIVTAGDKRVVVLGTQFSVRRDGDDVRVSVTEGAVRLDTDGTQRVNFARPSVTPEVVLPAGSIARSKGIDVLVQKESISEIQQNLSWRSGILTFRDTALADAVAEFNRYNERQIIINDPAIAALGVGGIFRSNNIGPFIFLIEEAFPIRVAHEKDRIILSSR